MTDSHVTIIGAGVIGICCACYLQRAGLRVTVIDRADPGGATSFGNAGGLGIGEVVPLSVPGLITKVPGWLADPMGPLALRWSYLPTIAPWLFRFIRAGRMERVRQISAALAALCDRTYNDFDPLLDAAGLQDIVQKNGALYLYDNQRELDDEQFKWDLRREHGLRFEKIPGAELPSMEPAIAPDFECAIFTPDWYHLLNPYRLVTTLTEHFIRNGGEFRNAEIREIEVQDSHATALTLTDSSRIKVNQLVIAAGAWSHQLSSRLGDKVPLETERGYHITLPDSGISASRQILYAAQGFVITPMEMGLRVAGTVELAGLKAPPDYRRAKVLIPKARRVYPGLRDSGGTEWMGHRPSTPDSLPVIGRSPNVSNVFHAFGHGHLGLTFGPTTGRLVTELITGTKPSLDLTPYRVNRF